jgi:hypothetical protein
MSTEPLYLVRGLEEAAIYLPQHSYAFAKQLMHFSSVNQKASHSKYCSQEPNQNQIVFLHALIWWCKVCLAYEGFHVVPGFCVTNVINDRFWIIRVREKLYGHIDSMYFRFACLETGTSSIKNFCSFYGQLIPIQNVRMNDNEYWK